MKSNRLLVLPFLAAALLAACSNDDSGTASGSGGGQSSTTTPGAGGSGGGLGGANGEGGSGSGLGGANGEGGTGGEGGSLPQSPVHGTINRPNGGTADLIAGLAFKHTGANDQLVVVLTTWPAECDQLDNWIFAAPDGGAWVRFKAQESDSLIPAACSEVRFSGIYTDSAIGVELTGSFPDDANTAGAVISGSAVFRPSGGGEPIGQASFAVIHCGDANPLVI